MPLLMRCAVLVLAWSVAAGVCAAQSQAVQADTGVAFTVVDENGVPLAGAQVELEEPGEPAIRVSTDYKGNVRLRLHQATLYKLTVEKQGFYRYQVDETDPLATELRVVLTHEQTVVQQVDVAASAPVIDAQQVSDKATLDVPAIVNIPYPTSRDIRNLLPYFPGVIQDARGQIHVAGSETWATLDTLDHFDIRSPISGLLAMRFSADAVRSIDQETTRYPVQYGRATGGVVAFYTGMGDNRFRFNATDFLPSARQVNGVRFDKMVPRLTFSGPLVRDRAWFFDGLEVEYDNLYIKELPKNADTNHLLRGSNLFRAQFNATPHNILSTGLLFNAFHSPYNGLSALVPQQSTTNDNVIAWLPYVRDQHSFHGGALLDVGVGVVHFRSGYEPHGGGGAFRITPETSLGSYFEDLKSRSQRVEGNGILYLPSTSWHGRHDLRTGIDLNLIGFDETYRRAPIEYLREDGSLLRRSTFPNMPSFTGHNNEFGAYFQDGWTPHDGILIEPGVRFDWDSTLRRPLFSPRIAGAYSPPGQAGRAKISAGIGIYYEHTQLEYLTRALAGVRFDQYFAPDGITPDGLQRESTFDFNLGDLHEARAVNWSIGLEERLPWAIYVKASLVRKRVTDMFVYANQTDPAALSGRFTLTNSRIDHDSVTEVEARHNFAENYTVFAAYTHSSGHTNAAIDYGPALSYLGPQQAGPLAWDVPDRVLAWGWLPLLVPGFSKHWDFVYTADWHTGIPFTAVNANQQVIGTPNDDRFPDYLSFSPGLEWRFHLRGLYLGLRGIMENATNNANPGVVNNVVDSPQFGNFSESYGRAITARIRLIQSKH